MKVFVTIAPDFLKPKGFVMGKRKICLGAALLGLSMLVACSEESSSTSASNKDSACSLNSSENGLAIQCGSEVVGYLKSSGDSVYGASCTAELLRDDSGYKLICGGDSVGAIYHGLHGRNGVNGSNGAAGNDGEDGADGKNGTNGTSCYAEQIKTGFDLYCADEKVGTISNGSNGKSCSVEKNLTSSVISCEDGTTATVLNGEKGIDGTDCSVSELKSEDADGKLYSTITCGENTVKVYDGIQGDAGASCTVTKTTTATYATVTCGTKSVKVYDGAKGDAGENCTASKNALTGVTTITCGDDEVTVSDGAKGDAGESCTASRDTTTGVTTITCGDDEVTVSDGSDGAQGNAGYSCSATSYTGYTEIRCQTGIDADSNAVYQIDTILTAGYAKCDDTIYNTLKSICVDDEIVAFNCGSTVIDEETQFCENGVGYTKTDYWTEATTYPKSAYEECGTGYYATATQFCESNVAYTKTDYWTESTTYPKSTYGQCGSDYYVLATHYCDTESDSATIKSIYAVCGTALYDSRTYFCAESITYELCGTQSYDPSTEFCSESVIYDLCGTQSYDPSTQECDTTDPENPIVVSKE